MEQHRVLNTKVCSWRTVHRYGSNTHLCHSLRKRHCKILWEEGEELSWPPVVEWVRGRGRRKRAIVVTPCAFGVVNVLVRAAAAAALGYPPWKTVSMPSVGSLSCISLFLPYPFSSSLLAACTRGQRPFQSFAANFQKGG